MTISNINQQFKSTGSLTQVALSYGLQNMSMCMEYLRGLPYGRNTERNDLGLVLSEQCGTCSSKHALCKAISEEQNIEGINLVLCIYKMTNKNTPGIGTHINDAGLNYIPEAHCYLDIEGEKIDITTTASSISRIEHDILSEEKITSQQVNTYKVERHKAFVKKWLRTQQIDTSFEEVWTIREQCIATLANNENNN